VGHARAHLRTCAAGNRIAAGTTFRAKTRAAFRVLSVEAAKRASARR
jgi:hypothetical protein